MTDARPTSDDDVRAVRALLGRDPQGAFEVVVRDERGGPVVIRNSPLLDDGTPMPTRYWLVGPVETLAVSRLESAGGVRAAEDALDPAEVAAAHARYAAERDAALDALDPDAPRRPSGGVGGTREGVKCLHAHYAWYLAGGDDPVGRWVARRLRDRVDVEIGDRATSLSHAGRDWRIPVGPATLLADHLAAADPPHPADLTNALAAVTDHLDDVLRERPDMQEAGDVHVRGHHAWHLAVVEHGGTITAAAHEIDRDAAEDLFRTLVTESRADRVHNPGLDPQRVDSVVATSCVVVGLMRTLQLERVQVEPAPAGTSP